jgi:hypothetical protein
MDILGSQAHPVVEVFPNNDAVFQDDDLPILPEAFNLGLRNMKMYFNIISG